MDKTKVNNTKLQDDWKHFLSYSGHWKDTEEVKSILLEAFVAAWEPDTSQLQTRLTLTETALEAARELLGMSSPETSARSDGVRCCDYCDTVWYDEHKDSCEFKLTKEKYFAALARLEEVTK